MKTVEGLRSISEELKKKGFKRESRQIVEIADILDNPLIQAMAEIESLATDIGIILYNRRRPDNNWDAWHEEDVRAVQHIETELRHIAKKYREIA